MLESLRGGGADAPSTNDRGETTYEIALRTSHKEVSRRLKWLTTDAREAVTGREVVIHTLGHDERG